MGHPTKTFFWGLASACGFLALIGYEGIALALVLIFGWLFIQHLVAGGFARFIEDLFGS